MPNIPVKTDGVNKQCGTGGRRSLIPIQIVQRLSDFSYCVIAEASAFKNFGCTKERPLFVGYYAFRLIWRPLVVCFFHWFGTTYVRDIACWKFDAAWSPFLCRRSTRRRTALPSSSQSPQSVIAACLCPENMLDYFCLHRGPASAHDLHVRIPVAATAHAHIHTYESSVSVSKVYRCVQHRFFVVLLSCAAVYK